MKGLQTWSFLLHIMCTKEMSISNHCQQSLVTKNWIIYLSRTCKLSSLHSPGMPDGNLCYKIIRYEGLIEITSCCFPWERWTLTLARITGPEHSGTPGSCLSQTSLFIYLSLTFSNPTKSKEFTHYISQMTFPSSPQGYFPLGPAKIMPRANEFEAWVIVNVLTSSGNIIGAPSCCISIMSSSLTLNTQQPTKCSSSLRLLDLEAYIDFWTPRRKSL